MIIKNSIEYYTFKEVAKMLNKKVAIFYDNIGKDKYPKVDKINNINHFSMDKVREYQEILGVSNIIEKEYFSSTEVANIVGRVRTTIVDWCLYSDELEKRGEARLIPAPDKVAKGNRRYWKKKSVKEIKHFADNIEIGDMAEYNRRNREKWGIK